MDDLRDTHHYKRRATIIIYNDLIYNSRYTRVAATRHRSVHCMYSSESYETSRLINLSEKRNGEKKNDLLSNHRPRLVWRWRTADGAPQGGRSRVYFIRLSRTARDVLLHDSILLLLLYNTRIIIILLYSVAARAVWAPTDKKSKTVEWMTGLIVRTLGR